MVLLRKYLYTLLQVSDVDSLCLKELSHDVPESTHTRYQSMYTVILSVLLVLTLLTLSFGRSASSRR